MTMIFISHDTGNTKGLLRAANKIRIANPSQQMKFLIVGESAQKIFSEEEQAIHKPNVILLSDWLRTSMSDLNERALSDNEKKIVMSELKRLNVEKAVTTSSCFKSAAIPYQIAEMLTEHLSIKNNIFLNLEFFPDMENIYWAILQNAWAEQITFLLAFAEARTLSLEKNPKLTCVIVGSSSLDDVYETKPDEKKINKISRQLLASPEQKLLFISGSKNITHDLELLNTLYDSLKAHPETAIRIGIHPGTSNMQNYVSSILWWLDQYPDTKTKLVITKYIKEKMWDTSILINQQHVLPVDVSGDDIFTAAEASASALPATLAGQAVIENRHAYCLPRLQNGAYLARFFAQSPDDLFAARTSLTRKPKLEIGLPTKNAEDLICDVIMGREIVDEFAEKDEKGSAMSLRR
jgi:hypothetical protein